MQLIDYFKGAEESYNSFIENWIKQIHYNLIKQNNINVEVYGSEIYGNKK